MVRRGIALLVTVLGGWLWLAPVYAVEVEPSVNEFSAEEFEDEPETAASEAGAAAVAAEQKPLRISMEFQDARLKDVLKTFSQQTGINVIAVKEIVDQMITLYLEDVAVLDALDQILAAGNLYYERPEGSDIYIVKPRTEQEDKPDTITRVYRLKFARVSKSILAAAATAFGKTTPFEGGEISDDEGSGGSGSGGSGGGIQGGGGSGAGEGIGIDTVLKELLSEHGDVVVDTRTNSLIVTDIRDNFPRIEAALAALDIRTHQIMVDAEVVETTLSKAKDLGFEWGTGSEGTLFTLTPAIGSTKFPFRTVGGLPLVNSKKFAETIADSAITTRGTLDFSQAQALLQALETDTDTKILARPKVLTLDNESAIIRLTADEAVGFATTSVAQTSTTTSEPERERTGVVLVVTPQVNDDGYITMLVEPSVTKTVASKLTNVPATLTTPRDPKTRTARTLVRVRNGDTLVIGGLIDRDESESLRRVPVLSGIPFFGEAFKNVEVSNSASELIVFITPRILDEAPSQMAMGGSIGPMSLREQERTGVRQEAMEDSLNSLEGPE